ncbi:NHL domain-containing thioredoxin family protein [Streptomyces sp. HB-N217]|uniref:NHL domain-containing thioredoxin family protein n=1 Tax=Streptomyces sp. HB-N217 TaxID=2792016 RepID=UPI0018D5E7C9|nr:NHL domain-containing thioredoxin family protein [Streptomyces sp. HB-N217]MBH5133474.1 NHL domain-containing thioredoxin family protein [Streptomyces sp. HB-N217]
MVKRARVRAPELVGRGGWINTGDRELSLAALRGRIVVLDFWTFCCVNCLHALDELRELEETHRDSVVIVGVHSPKFAHETEHRAVLDAVERYGVEHPVLDDPERATWRQYAVRAWPTLAVIDPEGYVVAQYTGEGHAPAIQRLVEELETQHAAKGTLRRGDAPYVAPEPEPTTLRFPGKAVPLPSGTFLVSDTTRHQLVELAEDGESPVRRVGSGRRGFTDGPAERAEFSEPQGLALLGDGSVVVADTVNHALRRYEPVTGEVTTLAGTGRQRRPGEPARGAARAVSLSSPWDVALWNGRVWIAMAGVHQLWVYDPRDGSVTVTAGTGNEGLVDGPGPEAWFAQPSGLSATEDRLWVADSETSALRWVELDGTVRTAVGTGLFDFGLRDGPAARALLQHPLGVAALPDGSVVVADTYNHALRRYAPPTGEVSTLASDLREPSDAVVVGDDILVVESARHRLTRLRLPQDALGAGAGEDVRRETTETAPGTVRLEVAFRAPAGQKPDLRYGPATRLLVSATPPELLRAGEGAGTDLSRSLDLDPAVPEGVLHVSATAASCDDDPDVPYPACHVHQKDWKIPVRLVEGASDRLPLVLTDVDTA